MSNEEGREYNYKVGGNLDKDAPSYVSRKADNDLYKAVKAGNLCYVFNSRQMGKTSLAVQMMKKLEEDEFACAVIDISGSGTDLTPEQWYMGVIAKLVSGFDLKDFQDSDSPKLSNWWRSKDLQSCPVRLSLFVEEVLLDRISKKIIIFFDEIDSIFRFDFRNDFFEWLRHCHNNPLPNYKRLNFVLLGVATPYDLKKDQTGTPFNIGQSIELDGFKLNEIEPLTRGLEGKVDCPDVVLENILSWTGGQPFLTQKLCKIVFDSPKSVQADKEDVFIQDIVTSHLINNWESNDEPPHLRTIRDRILKSQNPRQLLEIYKDILQAQDKKIGFDNNNRQHMELRLSGLVVKQEDNLKIYNRIYEKIFNESWVETELNKLSSPSEVSPPVLPIYTPIYIDNKAEEQLYEELKAGRFCYVLSSPQMRQSNMMRRVMARLEAEGIACAMLTLQQIDGRRSPDKFKGESGEKWWYFHFYGQLVDRFQISQQINKKKWWWDFNQSLSPAKRLDRFIEVVLLEREPTQQRIVIFIDEIDSIINLNFSINIFLNIIEFCYYKRNQKPKYNRLSFALQGKALSVEFIQNASSSDVVIREVLKWTNGQPFLTEKLYEIICNANKEAPIPDGNEAEWVERLVREKIIEDWENPEEPGYLRVIRDRLLNLAKLNPGILELYQRILQGEVVRVDDSPEVMELMRLGLIVQQEERLIIYNRIYESVFDRNSLNLEANKNPNIDSSNKPEVKAQSQPSSENGVKVDILSSKPRSQSSIIRQILTEIATYFNIFKRWFRRNLPRPSLLLILFVVTAIFIVVQHSIRPPVDSTDKLAGAIERIKNEALDALKQFESKELDALVKSVHAGKELNNLIIKNSRKDYPTSPIYALQKILYNIYERNYHQEHKAPVRNVSFSPDGRWIATSGEDGTVRIRNQLGQVRFFTEANQGNIRNVTFSPKEQFIITSGDNGTVRFWEWEEKNQPRVLLLQPIGSPLKAYDEGEVLSISLSPDGKTLATAGGNEGLVKLWDLTSRPFIPSPTSLTNASNKVERVVFSPDGKTIAAAEKGGKLELWNESGDKIKPLFDNQQGGIENVNFSPDNQTIATAGRNGTVAVWNLDKNSKIFSWPTGDKKIFSLSFRPTDGKLIATAGESGTVKLWDLSSNPPDEVAELNGHDKRVYSVSFSPDGKYLSTGGFDGTVRFWKLDNIENEFQFIHTAQNIEKIAIGVTADDRQRLVLLKDDRTIELRDIETKGKIDLQENPGNVIDISLSPDGKTIATVDPEGTVRRWDLSGDQLGSPRETDSKATKVILSPDKKSCLILKSDGKASFWELSGSNEIPLNNLQNIVNTLSISHDGQFIATGADDGTVKLWKYSEDKIINHRELKAHKTGVLVVKFSPDNSHIVTIGEDNTVKLWTEQGDNWNGTQLPITQATVADFSPDGKLIAIGGNNSIVSIWNLSGEQRAEFKGNWQKTVSLSFTPNGEEIVAAGNNGIVEKWPIETLEKLLNQGCEWLKDFIATHPDKKVSCNVKT